MDESLLVDDNMVVSLAYVLYVDDEIADSADASDPLDYIHGQGYIIPGLERELTGLKVGDKKTILVDPADGYGERMDDSIVELERSLFPAEYEPVIGNSLNLQDDQSDQVFTGYIHSFDDSVVRVDLNHPMAGKLLKFDTEIVGIRPASAHELESGLHQHDCSCCGGCGDEHSCG
jgi:FKBP-type peptidyl-prolyl cis-trans isomerase SlyD